MLTIRIKYLISELSHCEQTVLLNRETLAKHEVLYNYNDRGKKTTFTTLLVNIWTLVRHTKMFVKNWATFHCSQCWGYQKFDTKYIFQKYYITFYESFYRIFCLGQTLTNLFLSIFFVMFLYSWHLYY